MYLSHLYALRKYYQFQITALIDTDLVRQLKNKFK